MHEYEIFIEEINPCGGEKHSKKTLIEAEAVSPEAYVKENGRFPVLESMCNESGDVVIVTGDIITENEWRVSVNSVYRLLVFVLQKINIAVKSV